MAAIVKISILLGLALAFVILLGMRMSRRSGVRIPLGITAVSLFSSCYLLFDQIQPIVMLIPGASAEGTLQGIAISIWLSVAYLANVFIKRFVYRRRLTAEGDPKVPLIIQYLVTTLLYLFAVMVIIRVVFDQSVFALAATSGAIAIVLGYSARTVLDEIFAGIAINFSSPFEKGDLVKIGDAWAQIKDIGWRSITYLDMDNNDVVVPNSVVATATITNLDRPNGVTRRLYTFRIGYNVPPKVVLDLAMASMSECPHILKHDWNDACVYKLDETGIVYRAAFHIAHSNDWWLASNEYFNALWYSFKRAGIRFGQQRHLNFQNHEAPDQGLSSSALDDNNWKSLVERFNNSPMFEGMTNDDMVELAKSAELHVVGPPEKIIRAGSKRSSMFLIASGEADVYEVDNDGNETWMAEVGEGETVGLMALLVGAPQRTTIRARTETAVWEISSESLHALFDQKPAVMGHIAQSVAKWQADEEAALHTIRQNREKEKAFVDKRASSLRNLISRFFNDDGSAQDNSEGEGYTKF